MTRTLQLTSLILFILTSLCIAHPPPEKDEMTITELERQIFNLDGKVIEVEITNASSFEQISEDKYRAFCSYHKGTGNYSSESVLIPLEGKEFFEEIAKKDYYSNSSETVYILVHAKKPVQVSGGRTNWSFELEAVGTRFKKSKGSYSW